MIASSELSQLDGVIESVKSRELTLSHLSELQNKLAAAMLEVRLAQSEVVEDNAIKNRKSQGFIDAQEQQRFDKHVEKVMRGRENDSF